MAYLADLSLFPRAYGGQFRFGGISQRSDNSAFTFHTISKI